MDPTPDRRSPVAVEIPVAWGEMDAFQHVNNVVYLRWIETARMAYFERVRLMEGKDEEGVAPILARATVEYLRPVTYPDRVRVDASVERIGNTSFVMRHRVWSEAQRAPVARGESVIVLYDYRAGRPVPIGEPLRAAIAAVEASAA
jgi:acyl-CoA thioester hydrolase